MPSIAQLLPLLGEDYERKCIELGIIQRAREIKTPADLMTVAVPKLQLWNSNLKIRSFARLKA
jgi:hypothetical protein